jgi:hypothetical protein
VGLADHRREGAGRIGPRSGGPTAVPRRSHPFLFVVLGAMGPRMGSSLQPKAYTPVLHDVRLEPRAEGPSRVIARACATCIGCPPGIGRSQVDEVGLRESE